ncbi:YibE/F family protein [Sedimentibacter saalensis]|uniref:Putative membrane protein n=1 Tax=Sedimentibacter saalensis TaxID=130788 RepID=A0A562J898_9FIRM|nr:YibE/F family protein [Sedimentibacter saalensis]TWH79347.1 putative membrane protein [Sedimentibacter saalensis]
MELKNFNNSNKNKLVYILTILLSVAFILAGYNMNKISFASQQYDKSYKAEIISVDDVSEETIDSGYETFSSKTISFTARITNGDQKGTVTNARQYMDDMVAVDAKVVEQGDKILMSSLIARDGDGKEWTFVEYDRSGVLLMLLISFFLLIILFGRKKGLNTIISLVFTCLSIFMVFVPSILKGNNIYLSSIIVSIFIIFMSLLLINGADKKTLCAIVGNLGGLMIAGILAYLISKILNLTGITDDDTMFLLMLETEKPIDLIAVLWSSIVIGSLGAVMDVSMSIASALNELSENMVEKSFKTMLKSGFNIGQDAIGTMTNTLILAYIGSSLAVVLLLVANYNDTLLLFNLEMIVFEIIQAIIGSMGILFAIPITSVFAAYVYNLKK